MSPDKIKKYLIAGVIIVVIGGITAFLILRKGPSNTTPINEFPGNPETIEPIINPTESSDGSSQSGFQAVSSAPIAGYLLFSRKENEVENYYIRYLDKATGNAYEYDMQNNLRHRITNTTIPKISEAIWITSEKVVIRYEQSSLEQIVLGTIISDEESLDIANLPSNIHAIAPDKSGSGRFVYSIPNLTGSSIYIYNIDDDTDELVANIPLKDIRLSWDSVITVATLPSYTSEGYVYRLNTNSGQLTRIAGPFTALSFVDGESSDLISYREGSSLNLSLLGEVQIQINDITLADKCAWSEENNTFYCGVPESLNAREIPDSWYRGEVFFRDILFAVNPELGRAFVIYSPSFQLDMVNLYTKASFIAFKNRINNMLYYVDINTLDEIVEEEF